METDGRNLTKSRKRKKNMEEEPAGIAVFHPGGGVDGPEDVP